MSVYVPKVGALALLQSLAGTIQTLRLFKTDRIPTANDTGVEYDEADYNGYAPVEIEWQAPYINGDGKAEMLGQVHVFVADNADVPNTIYGAYATDSGGELIFAERWGSPKVVQGPGPVVPYLPVFTLTGDNV